MTRFLSRMPLAMSFVLAVFVVTAGSIRFFNEPGFQTSLFAVAVLIYVIWIIIESCLVSVREVMLANAPSDKNTFETYAIAQGLTAAGALLAPQMSSLDLWALPGLFFLVVGCILRLSAIVTLGRFYSRRVRLMRDHHLITYGPYRLVRHPAYLGTILGHLGFVLACQNPIPLAIWALFFVPMVVRRIIIEERVLFTLDGYAKYAKKNKRLIPLIW